MRFLKIFKRKELLDPTEARKIFDSYFKVEIRLLNNGQEVWTNAGTRGVIYKIEGRIKTMLFLYLPRIEMVLLKITNRGPEIKLDEVEITFLYKGKEVAYTKRTETLFSSLGSQRSMFALFDFDWYSYLREKGVVS